MGEKELRKILEETDDKLSVFADSEIFSKCKLSDLELKMLINDFLSDEEKIKLFDYDHFKQLLNSQKIGIIDTISDENMMLKMITRYDIVNGIESDKLLTITKKMSDSTKMQLIGNQEFMKKNNLGKSDACNIISSMTEENRIKILMNSNFIKEKLQLVQFQIADLVSKIASEKIKDKLIETYQFKNDDKAVIIKKYNNERKLDYVLKGEDLDKSSIIIILATLGNENLCEFLMENKKFCDEKKIQPYEIIRELNQQQQTDFISKMEEYNFTLNEKKKILAVLKEETKKKIDVTKFPEEYKLALSIQVDEFYGDVILDLNVDLEAYRGLDDIITINPKNFNKEQRERFIELCDICPHMTIITKNFIKEMKSSSTEYKEAEEWINSIMEDLKPEYSVAQKIAIIDNAIGKKISYSPDFDTEVFNPNNCRALWKIISSGYGVCNGIAEVEQYILSRIGIESEIITSKDHAFLKIKNIELTLASGEIVKGDTILDPTWNLAEHRFGAKPNNFFINYEKARQNDIDPKGEDTECHKNDQKLQDVTLGLDEESLRTLFHSVGLADKNGQFPIQHIKEKSKIIDENYADTPEQNISNQLVLLKEICPEFTTCQDSAMSMIKVLLKNENLKVYKRGVNRVYSKTDKKREPIMYVYIDLNEKGRRFYVANKEEGQFVEVSEKIFTEQFACYDEDLKASKRKKAMGRERTRRKRKTSGKFWKYSV